MANVTIGDLTSVAPTSSHVVETESSGSSASFQANLGDVITKAHGLGAWKIAYTNGSGVLSSVALGSTGTFLMSNGTAAPSFSTVAAGAGSSAGGSEGQIQYNSSGAFAGSTILRWDSTQSKLLLTGEMELSSAGSFSGLAVFNIVPSTADLKYSGQTYTLTVNSSETNTTFGQAYSVSTAGDLIAANAGSTVTMPCIGLAASSGTSAQTIIHDGFITKTGWNWTPRQLVYVSTSPSTLGGLTQTIPTTQGSTASNQVQIVGMAITADTIIVKPSLILIGISS